MSMPTSWKSTEAKLFAHGGCYLCTPFPLALELIFDFIQIPDGWRLIYFAGV